MDAAFVRYSSARKSLIAYTSVPRGKLRGYYRTVLHIELCLAATNHSGRSVVSCRVKAVGTLPSLPLSTVSRRPMNWSTQ